MRLYELIQASKIDSRLPSDATLLRYGDKVVSAGHSVQGNNYNLSEFNAAILYGMLNQLDEENRLRYAHIKDFEVELLKMEFAPQKRPAYITASAFYSFAFLCKTTEETREVIKILQDATGLGDFFIHGAYTPIYKNVLYRPWTKKKYAFLNMREDDWKAAACATAEYLYHKMVVIHHSLFLRKDYLTIMLNALKQYRTEG